MKGSDASISGPSSTATPRPPSKLYGRKTPIIPVDLLNDYVVSVYGPMK
jgi:hypothetical protein